MIALKLTNSIMFRGMLARRFVLRIFMLVAVMAMFPFLQLVYKIDPMEYVLANTSDCISKQSLFPGRYLKPLCFFALPCLETPYKPPSPEADANLTNVVVKELIDMKLLNSGARALCVGEGSESAVSALLELGFSNAFKAKHGPLFPLLRRGVVDKLSFNDESFDFVFSKGLDQVPVPALLVLEIDRVLKPGGIGAVLVNAETSNPGGLIKAATPVSSYLKSSVIVHVGVVDAFTLVVFRKNGSTFSSFEYYHLPDNCHSVMNNKPFVEYLEPLVEENPSRSKENFAYLTKFVNISGSKHFIYIEVGAGAFINSSISNWFLPSYPKQLQSFDIYAVDHNSSVLTSYAGRHDVTFVYYPALSGNWTTSDNDLHEESASSMFEDEEPELFSFLDWFKQTVEYGDFVVMKMNAGGVGFKLLHELFESGAMCLVDELFLRCQNSADARDATGGDCLQLFKALRSRGVFVHQW